MINSKGIGESDTHIQLMRKAQLQNILINE